MREITRRAGLGIATVYRHFPSRPDLIGAVLVEQVAIVRAEMQAALDTPTPGVHCAEPFTDSPNARSGTGG